MAIEIRHARRTTPEPKLRAASSVTKKENKLIDAIVALADEQFGERSEKAKWLFKDIASECRERGYAKLARIMQRVADHYQYD